jgi:peptidoglycan/xylan/chitin deacetylase (PgdA/CDA1 family)
MTAVPVLCYHAVGRDPSPCIAPLTVTPEALAGHLAAIADAGRTPVTAHELAVARLGGRALPERPVVLTFDDGFADTHTVAAPLLAAAGVRVSIYVVTGAVGGRSAGGDPMLTWRQVVELAELGHEIGGHSRSHAQLDVLPAGAAFAEVSRCKEQLEGQLGRAVRGFAHPHGYSTRRVRRQVAAAGFEYAVGLGNRPASAEDDLYNLSRLTLTARTTRATVQAWLDAESAPSRGGLGGLRTGVWRTYRRTHGRLHGSEDGWAQACPVR